MKRMTVDFYLHSKSCPSCEVLAWKVLGECHATVMNQGEGIC